MNSKANTCKIGLPHHPGRLSGIFIFLLLSNLVFNCTDKMHTSRQQPFSGGFNPDDINISRGICVLLGDKNCNLARGLAEKSELLIYVQLPLADDADCARRAADSAGFYGTRIYVEHEADSRIHLADNLADVLVSSDSTLAVSETEILRVLRPGGIAFLYQRKLTKPLPEGADDWSHPFHGPDNNPQSEDQLIRAPYLTQFLADPRYAPATQATVASAGRVFKAFGNVAFHEREEPYLNTLVAFNGYNGTLLWKRDLVPGIMLHRNILIATPKILYMGDDKSCKLIDTGTGQLKDEIKPPSDFAGGTFWKWMGMENGTLYALLGEQEQKDPVMRWRRMQHGWPWNAISNGFNKPDHPWGFGRNMLAIDPETHEILWHYHEQEPVDSRALCMKNGRIFLFRFGAYLTCLDANSGKILWRKTPENSPDLFAAIGEYLHRQSWESNWRTRNYLMCSDKALYFAGPQMSKLLAVSTKDGSVLWENPYDNFQLVLRDDGLYGISGPWRSRVSKKFNPLTGEVLAEIATGRRACTRPNGTSDAILFRANGGTVRLDLASLRQQWISPMRPSCQDGVTVANGLQYWWPFVCDCQLSIYGVTGLGPAGEFDFNQPAVETERLKPGDVNLTDMTPLLGIENDWTTFRGNNQGTVTSDARIAPKGRFLWHHPTDKINIPATNSLGHLLYTFPTAPVTADGLVFYADTDGIVRALNLLNGELVWKAYTAGSVRLPPAIWKDRVFVGSGDGWVYCFAAKSGNLIWRFRAAPVERKIPVYGTLLSTWPVASGVLVEDGIAYFAAGIQNYDGIHVYALDAESGNIVWQNNSSGHLDPEARTGVGVHGHLLLHAGKLYLAGGTSISPAIYDIKTGDCLNDPEPLKRCESASPRGWELFKLDSQVAVAGEPFYGHPDYKVFDYSVSRKIVHASSEGKDIVWINNKRIACYNQLDRRILKNATSGSQRTGLFVNDWDGLRVGAEPVWEYNCEESVALAVCKNAVVIAEKSELAVLNIADGRVLWRQALMAPPVPWGLAVARDGKIVVALKDGQLQCFGGESTIPMPYVRSDNSFFVGSTDVVLACNSKNAQIRYTTDDTEPTQDADRYSKPFQVNATTTIKMRTFESGRAPSFVTTHQLTKLEYQTGMKAPANMENGLSYNYYEGVCGSVDDLKKFQPLASGIKPTFNIELPKEEVECWGFSYDGLIKIPEDGIYTFFIESNDGSKLFINGAELINNDGDHGAIEKSGTVALRAGLFPIQVRYYQAGASKVLKVRWQGPGFGKTEIPAAALFHQQI
ncbi:PQQ-binding-like beta-propeller repeat protein [candidate division KSB1 bacterium]|nr:PQQ-binding-like beta-propeller repeat protein [candidate division KSB1 bacterium]